MELKFIFKYYQKKDKSVENVSSEQNTASIYLTLSIYNLMDQCDGSSLSL